MHPCPGTGSKVVQQTGCGALKKVAFDRGMLTHAFVWKKIKGVVYIALYLDDSLMIGHPVAIDEAIELL